jgi:sugar transferase (PEP-CTERM/EpsH1 system associated)
MPVRIMHIVYGMGRGGLENGLVNLVHRLNPSQFEHTVCAISKLGANAERLPSDRVRITCMDKNPGAPRIMVPALSRAIREFRPHIVHTRNWGALEGVFAARWVGSCAIVHSEHGLESDASVVEPRRRTCFRRLAFELADRVLAVSFQLRDLHAKRTGFSAKKMTVIHNGVDRRKYFPDSAARERVRREFRIGGDEFCIGCVGNLLPVKDHKTLLRALEVAGEACKPWRLLIVGEGPERAELERFVKAQQNWSKQIHFLGSSERVSELLNAMDLFVLPSAMEGINNSILEAMATGLPVVVTDVGGNPEVVVDRNCGLLFPPRDFRKLAEHMVSLRLRSEHRVQLGQQAIRVVQREFSIESMIQKYKQLYESLASSEAAAERAVATV